MKKILFFLAVLLISMLSLQVQAQTYTPLPFDPSAFNVDVIANGNGQPTSSTSTYYDSYESQGVYYSDSYRTGSGHTAVGCGGIPNTGVISRGSGYPRYQLVNVDASGTNCLLLINQWDAGVLRFTSPGYYTHISICASSSVTTVGSATIQAVLKFHDGTRTYYSFIVPDWFNTTATNYSVTTLGRVFLGGSTAECADEGDHDGCVAGCDATTTNPRFFDCIIALNSTDKFKVLDSITCRKTDASTQKCGVFAVCGVISDLAPLAVIADPGTSVTRTSFQANWHPNGSDPHPPTSYYLDVSSSSSFDSFLPGFNNFAVPSGTSWSVTGMTPGAISYYRVRGANADGVSPNSNVIMVIPPPLATAATNKTSTSFDANWTSVTPSPPVTGYYLDVSTDPNFGGSWIINNLDVTNVLTYPVSSISPGPDPTTYYYRVRAHTATVTSDNSNVISIVYTPPVAPGIKPYYSTSCGTCWSCWWPSGGSFPATSYLLDVATDSGFTTFVGSYHDFNVGNVTTYLVTGLTPGVTYYYRVRGASGEGIGPYSGTFSFVM